MPWSPLGAVTVFIMNLDQEVAVTLDDTVSASDASYRWEWALSGLALDEPSILVNGVELVVSSDGKLPLPIAPKRVPVSSSITLEPLTSLFVVMDARAAAC